MIMPSLKIGDMVSERPVIQGGMGVGVSLSGLASAVANCGGIGVIATAGIAAAIKGQFVNNAKENLNALRNELRKARKSTNGLIGVNIMVALANYDDLIGVALEEGADVIFTGAGLPIRRPKGSPLENSRNYRTKMVPKVSSPKALQLIIRYWQKHYGRVPDAVVLEGPECGGHIGFTRNEIDSKEFSLKTLLPQVLKVARSFESEMGTPLPVIAAGGIYTGVDIRRALEQGADGVKMATRFVTTHECDADDKFKQAYIACNESDLIIIDSPLGLPGRAIKSTFLSETDNGEHLPEKCEFKCITTCNYEKAPYCIARALANSQQGNLKKGFVFAGANAYKATKITSVAELFEQLDVEFTQD